MYGKLYIYITIFLDIYSDFSIKQFYFDDCKSNYSIFDDGILRYYLSKLKIWL